MRKAYFALLFVALAAGGALGAATVREQSLDVVYNATLREISGTLTTAIPASEGSTYFLLLPNLDRDRNPHLSSRQIDARYPFGFEESALDIDHVALVHGEEREFLPFRLLSMPPGLQTYSLADTILAIDGLQTESTVEIRFTTRAPRIASGDGGVTDGVFTWRFGWFPLAVDPSAGLREEEGTLYAGGSDAFPLVFPLARTRATITVPADVTLTAGADRVVRQTATAEEDGADAVATYVLENDSPARSLTLTFGTGFERYTLDGPLPIEVTYKTGHVDEARLLATYARDIFADFIPRFGPYVRPIFRIVENENPGGSAFSADGIALLSTRFFTHRDVLLPGVLHRLTEFVLAHEIAHQWFGMRGEIDLDRDGWLSEGLAQYASVGYFERAHGATDPNLIFVTGKGVLEDFVATQLGYFNLREHMIELPYARNIWDGFDEALATPAPEVRFANASAVRLYDKGFMVARALAAAVGEEAFDGVLSSILGDGEPQQFDTAALQQRVEQATGRSFEAWFAAWVTGDATVDYSAKVLSRSENDATYETEVQVRRDGGVSQDVEVQATLVSGATTRLTWDAVEEEGTLLFRTPSPVARVTIDPDHRLPDRDRINNHSPVRIIVAADKAVFPLDAYVLAPDAGSSGLSFSRLDRFRVGLSQNEASLLLRRGRGEVFTAELSFAGPLVGSVEYSNTSFLASETGAPGTVWEPGFTFAVSGRRILSAGTPLYVVRGSIVDLPTTGESSTAGVALDIASSGHVRLAAVAGGDIGILPRIYAQATGFVGFGLGDLPAALKFGFGELHATRLAVADVKAAGALGLELPSLGNLPYNVINLAMIDDVRTRLYMAGGAGWTRSGGFGTTSAGAEAGMEQVFTLSTLGGFLPFAIRAGIAIPLQGEFKPVLYASFSL